MSFIKVIFIVLFSTAVCLNAYARELDPGKVEDKLLYYEYHNYEINITSIPSGARIYINDEYVGESPVTYYADGKVSKLNNFIIEARPQIDSEFHYPQKFTVKQFSIIPRHIHLDMLHTVKRI